MVIKHQIISPGNIHIFNNIKTEQVILYNICITAISEKTGQEESKEEYLGGFRGRKGKGEVM